MTAPSCNCFAKLPALGIDRPHEEWCTKNGGWECPHCDEPRYPGEAECHECKLPRAAADAYLNEIDGWCCCRTCGHPHPSVDMIYHFRCDACAERVLNTNGYELHHQERAKLLAKVLAEHQPAA